MISRSIRAKFQKQLQGSTGVSFHADNLTFSRFDASGGQFDQTFEEIRQHALTTGFDPETFPNLVSFPVVACVEQIDRVQKGT